MLWLLNQIISSHAGNALGVLVFSLHAWKSHILSGKRLDQILTLTDAMGLAVFSIAGVEKALMFGHGKLIAVLMGVFTAIGGGIAADVVSNRAPVVFSSEFYITVSFVGSVAYLFLSEQINHPVAAILSLTIMILFRMLSVFFKLGAPK